MILVTGAAGTVGTEVVKGLSAAKAPFRVGYRSRKPSGVEAVPLDLDKPETFGPALRGVESVFLLSNAVSPEVNLVRAAKAAGLRRIVKLSALHAADEAYTFARWHRGVEREIEASGMEWTFLRPNWFMQNFVTQMAGTIKRGRAFYAPVADAAIAAIDVRDVAAVAVKALTPPGHGGKAYELTGPESLTFTQAAATLSKVLGHEIRFVPVPAEDYKKTALPAGVPEAVVDAVLDLYRHYRTGGAAARVTSAVRDVTGREPIRFEQFVRDYADALR